MEKRVFLIVLDSFGIGAEPDAPAFGDAGTNTLGAIAKHPNFNCPNLQKLGLFNIDGVTAGEKSDAPVGAFARLQEQSMGKDTTIGHWEIAGVVSPKPLPTFPNGFPAELIHAFEEKTGHKVLCNKPYSGTQVLKDYGEQAMQENALIVYTSADLLMITADHGCDPSYTKTTDHTREYVPYLICGKGVKPGVDLGTKLCFGTIAHTICDYLGVDASTLDGQSILPEILK